MAKTSMKIKQNNQSSLPEHTHVAGGRPHSVLRKYGICRVCFRELAYKEIQALSKLVRGNELRRKYTS